MEDKKEYLFKCKKCGKQYKLYLTDYELKSGKYSKHCSRRWVHKYNDNEKIYYTKVINPSDYNEHINNGWISGRGKCIDGYVKEHIKTNSIFKRLI